MACWSERLTTTRDGPVESLSRRRYWPGFKSLSPNTSNMPARVMAAASDAAIVVCGVSIVAHAAVTAAADANILVAASWSASFFICLPYFFVVFQCGNAWHPCRVPISAKLSSHERIRTDRLAICLVRQQASGGSGRAVRAVDPRADGAGGSDG